MLGVATPVQPGYRRLPAHRPAVPAAVVLTPTACLALAAALLCAPAAPARARLAALCPTQRQRRSFRAVAAGPVLLGGAAGFLAAGPGGAMAGALVAVIAKHRRARSRDTAAVTAVTEQLAEALGRMAEEVRSGSHPAGALAGVEADGPLARRILAPAATAAALGDDIAAAMRRASAENPTVAADLDRLASAWSLSERHGVPLADLLAGAQADLRWRVRFGATVRSQLAGPRATAGVLTALPVLGLALGQLMGADPLGVLRSGLVGQALVVVGVGLAAAGSFWSDRIMLAAVPR